MDWLALVATFGAIFLVELPDKTLVATLVLSTKYRHLPVFIGVSLAFLVQCVIAVTAGSLLRLLPEAVVEYAVAALFAIGAIILWRSASEPDDDEEADTVSTASTLKMATVSFTVLFAAEWGDASQLATAALTARYHAPFSVGIGAWLALVGVAAVAILLGKAIQKRVPLHLIQRIAAVIFAILALVALYTAISG